MLLALIQAAALIVLGILVVRLIRDWLGPSRSSGGGGGGGIAGMLGLRRRSGFPCRTCRHCGKLFEDGVLCRYGNRETFKNPTHIANCMDYERRG